jgi:hypothetical protein
MPSGYNLFFSEFAAGRRGLPGTHNMREAADMWNAMTEQAKNDFIIRAKKMKKIPKLKKSPKKKSMHGATKRKLFIEGYLDRYPGYNKEDAITLWQSLSQADRDAYIGL